MTGLVHPPTDDLSGAAALRPLDFSNLLAYSQDPILPSASLSPAVWPVSTLSPLCSATSRLAPAPSALASDPSASLSNLNDGGLWFGPLSPLFKSSPRIAPTVQITDAEVAPQREPELANCDSATVSTGVWDTAAAQSSTAPNMSEADSVSMPFVHMQPSSAFTADTLEMVQPTKQEAGPQPTETDVSTSPYAHSVSTASGGSQATVPEVPKVATKKEAKGDRKSAAMTRKVSQTMSSIDKAAERRRKNRESSSRCYYNRKRIIETLDKQISLEKSKLTSLYDRALELRHENARLKKDVVTKGIALPTKTRSAYRPDNAFQLQGYLQFFQAASF